MVVVIWSSRPLHLMLWEAWNVARATKIYRYVFDWKEAYRPHKSCGVDGEYDEHSQTTCEMDTNNRSCALSVVRETTIKWIAQCTCNVLLTA